MQNIPIQTEIGREIQHSSRSQPPALVTADLIRRLRLSRHPETGLTEAFHQERPAYFTTVAAQVHHIPIRR